MLYQNCKPGLLALRRVSVSEQGGGQREAREGCGDFGITIKPRQCDSKGCDSTRGDEPCEF